MASSVQSAALQLRRRQVFESVAAGVAVEIIAKRVGVSPSTVRKDYELAAREQERIAEWTKSATSKRRRK